MTLTATVEDFIDLESVRCWVALSAAEPEDAVRRLEAGLSAASVEDRRRIANGSRRQLVFTLRRLAWRCGSFFDAAKSLALLAEAENEDWANNATSEFVGLFQVVLGGTAVPYRDRLSVIDRIVGEPRPAMVRLAVTALARVGAVHASRMGLHPNRDEVPEREWYPGSPTEYVDCVRDATDRLIQITATSVDGVQEVLIDAAKELCPRLGEGQMGEHVGRFFEAVRKAFPESREPLRRMIADRIRLARKYGQSTSAEGLQVLDGLHARFEDTSLKGRLEQLIGIVRWPPDEQVDLGPLARELVASREALAEHWPWLTSGGAAAAGLLGEAIARRDVNSDLLDVFESLSTGGPDHRLVCGYLNIHRESRGDDWYDQWMASQAQRDPKPVDLLFEVAWRCGVTRAVAGLLTSTLRSQSVLPGLVNQLSFGRWDERLPSETLEDLLRAMAGSGHRETAIAVLERRMRTGSDGPGCWKELALDLVTDVDIIRGSTTASCYAWKEVAARIVADHPREIAAAIFEAHAADAFDGWYADQNDAASVLWKCVAHDAVAVWETLLPHISSPESASFFVVGFPRGVLDRMPFDVVVAWIGEQPEGRLEIAAKLASKDLSNDATLMAKLVEKFGLLESGARAFYREYTTGGWSGPASAHWDDLAGQLEAVADRTVLPGLRHWARESARSLTHKADWDRGREEEEGFLRGR